MYGHWSAKEPLVEKLFLEEMERSTSLCPDFFKNIMDYLCFFVRCCLFLIKIIIDHLFIC